MSTLAALASAQTTAETQALLNALQSSTEIDFLVVRASEWVAS